MFLILRGRLWRNREIFHSCTDISKIRGSVEKIKFKSCSELNFLQKRLWAHMSIYHRSGTKGLRRYALLKYYNALT